MVPATDQFHHALRVLPLHQTASHLHANPACTHQAQEISVNARCKTPECKKWHIVSNASIPESSKRTVLTQESTPVGQTMSPRTGWHSDAHRPQGRTVMGIHEGARSDVDQCVSARTQRSVTTARKRPCPETKQDRQSTNVEKCASSHRPNM